MGLFSWLTAGGAYAPWAFFIVEAATAQVNLEHAVNVSHDVT
jgi:hypothetical protein